MVSTRFRITVKALIPANGGLVVVRKPDGRWDLPGGRVQDGEPLESALRREIDEELGIQASIREPIYCGLRRKDDDPDVYVVAYLCTTDADLSDIKLSFEHVESRLVRACDISGLEINKVYADALRHGFRRLDGAPTCGETKTNG